MNLDSYWDNLSASQLPTFVAHCHANGQKAGVYWTPFVDWGEVGDRADVEGTASTPYSDIWLYDASNKPIPLDGAYAVDPTNAATKTRVDYFIDMLKGYGFDYIKLDFLCTARSRAPSGPTPRCRPASGLQPGDAVRPQPDRRRHVRERVDRAAVSVPVRTLAPGLVRRERRGDDGQGSAEYELNSATYGWWMSGRTYTSGTIPTRWCSRGTRPTTT